jgi:hypothetical protein
VENIALRSVELPVLASQPHVPLGKTSHVARKVIDELGVRASAVEWPPKRQGSRPSTGA